MNRIGTIVNLFNNFSLIFNPFNTAPLYTPPSLNVFPMKNDFEPHRNPYITGFLLFFHCLSRPKAKKLAISQIHPPNVQC